MELDYSQIGKRIAQRRKELGLKQAEVCERAGINDKYLSCIERATSIPSLEVVMKLALALDTTPDTFLTGSVRYDSDEWRDVAELMRGMSAKKLNLAKSFLTWLSEQSI
ncbi:MAG: helix-turn-helix transcriptional regulator [Firmicutes bacterium]|nr:helix-turn-helix transcriptional regulator [Bacillota bacterium]